MKIIAFTKWIEKLPLKQIAEIVQKSGFDGVDLPVRSQSPITEDLAPKVLPEAERIFADHGLTIETIVSGISAPRPGLDELLEAFRSVGVTKIRLAGISARKGEDLRTKVDAVRRDLEGLEPVFRRHGIRGALQIHSGPHLLSNVGICLHLLEGRDPACFGIQLDSGHLALSGEMPHIAINLAGQYLHTVNFKAPRLEPAFDPEQGKVTWRSTWVPLWDGIVDWEEVLVLLKEAGYTGPISIHAEYRSLYDRSDVNIEFSNEAMRKDCAYVRSLMKKIGIPAANSSE